MGTMRIAGRLTVATAVQSLRFTAAGVAVAAQTAERTTDRAGSVLSAVAGELADIGPQRMRRHTWRQRGHAHVEVRGLAGPAARTVAAQVTASLRRLKGVRWAEVNAVTQQVLVAFDERDVGLGTILDTIEAVEAAHDAGSAPFDRDKPEIPGDRTAEYAAAAGLAAGVASAALAAAGRLTHVPVLPRAARLPVTLADAQPRVRAALEGRLGKRPTELLFWLASSAASVSTADPLSQAVDSVQRALALLEVRSRRLAWERRHADLSRPAAAGGPPPASSEPAGEAPVRPVPLPPGPVEQAAERTSLGALAAAAGVLALTRNAGGAADVMLATVPRAARLGREAFASMLGHELSSAGVVPMETSALRRLDRVSAVVIDSAVLAPGGEPDPLADALISAARSAARHVLLTSDPAAADLLSWADDLVPAGADVAKWIRELQSAGHAVLVITDRDDAALAAADVGVALVRDAGVCWSADLLCGASLAGPWRILRAAGVARRVSERSGQLAVGGAALGALLVSTGGRSSGGGIGARLSPVHGAAGVAVFGGALSARRLTRLPVPRPAPRARWHELTADQVRARLRDAVPAGSAGPAEADGGAASADGGPRPGGLLTGLGHAVLGELRDPLTPVLALGAAASAIVGSAVDAVLVGGVMAGNALIGGAQRVRAERALRSLFYAERLPARRVLADGSVQSVPADGLVPGDVVTLRPADVVPADLRLLDCQDLEVDEATLTGESLPVAKNQEPVPGADLAERSCMLYEGTTILTGTARGIVVAVGDATEAGRAAAVAGHAGQAVGVQARLAELTRITLPATGVAGAAVTSLSLAHRLPFRRALASGIALAVAAVPEGLPLVATVSQLAAARRLSRRGILVRSARTLEALGRVDTFCFDKTGTLTEGRLSVARLAGTDGDLSTDDPRGRHLLRTAARACPASEGKLTHATDQAVVDAAARHLEPDDGWQVLTELPFETNRGYAAALGMNSPDATLAVKGAPEVILDRCTWDADGGPLSAQRRRAVASLMRALAGDGLRVIAVAEARLPAGPDSGPGASPGAGPGTGAGAGPAPGPGTDDLDALGRDMTLLGFVGIADRPRPAAARTVERLAQAGIRVTMITGDHPLTAVAIARRLGVDAPGAVLTGAELDSLPERERLERVPRTTVFARVSPEQKVRVVQALQRSGHVVAMTGDGANDAAAIRLADVGIGVRGKGSTSARTAADLVLTDPDPARLVEALTEGRSLWVRVRDAVSILVGGNAGEVAFTLLGTAVGGDAPLNARQLLLVNMLTDMMPALAVALGPAGQPAAPNGDADLSAEPAALSGAGLVQTLAVRGSATAAGASAAWYLGRLTGRRRRASTMGLAALVLTQLGQTLLMGWRSPLVLATCAASAAVLAGIVETPGVSQFFGCTPLGPGAWVIVTLSSAAATAGAALFPRFLPVLTGS